MSHLIKIFSLFLVTLTMLPQSASAADFAVQIPQKIVRQSGIDKSDLKLYKRIFQLLDKKDYTAADPLIAKLDNHLLLGHVLAAKYLNTKYPSSTDELTDWLHRYSDHYQAPRIKRLLERKSALTTSAADDTWLTSVAKISPKYLERLSRQDKTFLTRNTQKFRTHLRQGKTLAARQILEGAKFQKLAPKPYWDQLAASLALKYLLDNHDTKALEWGKKASARHNSGMATWIAGLASWRLKQFKTAASYFARLGSSHNSDIWLIAAGAYWSARAYEKIGNTLKAQEMLKLGAKYKYTFYGILSAYQLGQEPDFAFDRNLYISDFSAPDYIDNLVASQAFCRAIALMEIKQPQLAAQEIYHSYRDFSDLQKEAVILIAHQKGLHSVVIHINRLSDFDNLAGRYEKELYPLPAWSKKQKLQIDQSLLLALIRQESAFNNTAKSHSGALGLMQLMPNTAVYISGDKTLKNHRDKLYDTEFNLRLGQKYVTYLLTKPFIEGNLFFMLTAYNAGPGNLAKWQKSARFQDDPLLFIEVIPSAETRIYIERVMSNYWIYNLRLKQRNLTLEQVAADKWPVLEEYHQILFD
ncbi:MAG: lytic transglycosylase domain-containing protein [Alphaproteobacteria bacterium]|nr:lytic transglycosylase domain-containing protein [Alphaproteobacteria bacterium]